MPCLAKKHECAIPAMNDACGDPDVDVVLTTREVDRLIRSEYIDPANIEDAELDMPLGSLQDAPRGSSTPDGTGARSCFPWRSDRP